MFAYCANNPGTYTDQGGQSATLAAVVGAALAGTIINTVSYIVGCGLTGTEITGEGLGQARLVGAVNGALGAGLPARLGKLYSL